MPAIYSFALSSPVSIDCVINLTSTSANMHFLPSSSFSFSASSASSLLRTFQIRAYDDGNFTVSTNTSGCSNKIYSDSFTLMVLDASVPPPGPKLTQAIYSNNGLSAIATFDVPTDRMSKSAGFDCSLLFSFPFASQSLCTWMSDDSLLLGLSASAGENLEVGSVLELLGGKLRARCTDNIDKCVKYNTNLDASIALKPPALPIRPSITLSLASEVFTCDGLSIDPTGSYGSCGKPWVLVKWSVERSDGNSTRDLETFLNEKYNTTSEFAMINSSLISVGTYSVTLKLMNRFDAVEVLTKTVNIVEPENRPLVMINGKRTVTLNRPDALSLFASASAFKCLELLSDPLIYSWRVYEGYQLVNLKSVSVDARAFKLESHSLTANTVYTFEVSAAVSTSPLLSSKALVYVVVGISPVKALIAGGVSRTAIKNAPITLDASSSFDPDSPEDDFGLSFEWSCMEYSPSYGGACVLGGLDLKNTSVLEGTLTKLATYQFTVTVRNRFGSSDSYSSLFNVVGNPLPTVMVTPLSAKVNSNSRVLLEGLITVPENQTAVGEWSCQELDSSLLEDYALVPLRASFPSRVTSAFNLGLASGLLSPGAIYNFVLTGRIADDPSRSTTAVVSITMNSPPMYGRIEVDPVDGISLQDSFFLLTYSWSDDPADYPLNYGLYFYVSDRQNAVLVKPFNEGNAVSSSLPQGLESQDYTVTCVAVCVDILGDSGEVSTTVTVRPLVNQTMLENLLELAFSTALLSGDVEAISASVTVAYSAINTVNCTTAPDCATLNREGCSIVANTCGSCLSDFVGVAGYANSACYQAGGRRLSSRPEQLLVEESSPQEQLSLRSKSCVGDCSNNGACLLYDVEDAVVQSCPVVSFSCYAKCKCFDGWDGRDCSRNVSGMAYLNLSQFNPELSQFNPKL